MHQNHQSRWLKYRPAIQSYSVYSVGKSFWDPCHQCGSVVFITLRWGKKKTVTQAIPRPDFILKASPDVFAFHWRSLHSGHTDWGFAVKRVDAQGWWAMCWFTSRLISFFRCFTEDVWVICITAALPVVEPQRGNLWAAESCLSSPPAPYNRVAERLAEGANGSQFSSRASSPGNDESTVLPLSDVRYPICQTT